MKPSSALVLEDGSVFRGKPFGSPEAVSGEVVFSTGMVGYTQSLTDPSFRGQVLVFTYPLIGNYGVSTTDFESSGIQVRGLVVSELSGKHSHWAAQKSLESWMKLEGVPGIQGVDTRALALKLREGGVMLGAIVPDGAQAPEFANPNDRNLAAEASIKQPVIYEGNSQSPLADFLEKGGSSSPLVVLVDTGAKESIVKSLLHRGLAVARVPWDFDFFRAGLDFSGVVLSNGPGDPKKCVETIRNAKRLLEGEVPVFGVCLGNQLMALAAGADTFKLKYGHRGQNQPCVLEGTKRCFITSQNHGFAVDVETLPSGWRPLFSNANDGTNEGIMHESGLFFSAQFHPEASPGPHDTSFLFDDFKALVSRGARR